MEAAGTKEPQKPDDDEVEGNNVVQQLRHDQNQNAGDKRNKWADSQCEVHDDSLVCVEARKKLSTRDVHSLVNNGSQVSAVAYIAVRRWPCGRRAVKSRLFQDATALSIRHEYLPLMCVNVQNEIEVFEKIGRRTPFAPSVHSGTCVPAGNCAQ